MTDGTLSTALVLGWFVVPHFAGLPFGWRGVAIATALYAIVVPAISLIVAGQIFLAGSLTLLPLMALFIVGLNVAIFALLKTVAELFGKTPEPEDPAP